MKNFLITSGAVFVGATASLLSINGLTAAHHNYWAYEWSQTCDFKSAASFHAQEAAKLNPLYGQTVVDIEFLSPCHAN